MQIDPRQAGAGGLPGNTGVVRINYGLGNGSPDPDLSLDVNGQANIRTVNQDNTLTRVLVWEPASGNVRWSNALGGFGQDCTTPGTPGALTTNRKLPMNTFNFYFEGQNAIGQNSVGIGYANCPALPAKLSVLETGTGGFPIAIQGISSGGLVCVGGDFLGQSAAMVTIGVRSFATSSGGVSAVGGQFRTFGALFSNFGVVASGAGGFNSSGVRGTAGGATNENVGVFAAGNGGTVAYGVNANASGGATNYAVFATCLPSSGNTPPTGPNYAGWFDGDVVVTGTFGVISDSALKTNILSFNNADSILEALNPITFNYNVANYPQMSLDNGFHWGIIAQQAENICPSLVSNDVVPAVLDSMGNIVYPSFTVKTLNYVEFIPILIQGHNEQQDKIDAQDSTIAAMQQQMNDMMAMVNNCCSQGNNSLQAPNNNGNNTNGNNDVPVHTTDVRLIDNYCVLGENSPNPFRDHTVINYNIAEAIKEAQIVFYNNLGQIIKVLEINDRGEGRLNVYGEDLRSGMYTYSLIVDGNVCESKKMIKE